jgi:uncharacterized damage-inducible protein DinB
MAPEQHPAEANIHYLKQGMALIRRLGDEAYAECPDHPFRGGVGAQFRHCLDFYDCFLAGLAGARIDYNRRGRDRRVEADREHALQKMDALCRALGELTVESVEGELEVRVEQDAAADAVWNRSSAARELQFLVSHTVHHYALIAMLLKLQGYDVGGEAPEFGVAPSTLGYWKETGSIAG